MTKAVITPRIYLIVYAILLVLTLATVGLSFLHLETALHLPAGFSLSWHTILGLSIAVSKATLIVLFFMHVIHSDRLTVIAILGGLFWLGILFLLTLTDYLTRPWLIY